jgi:hypothetical protein
MTNPRPSVRAVYRAGVLHLLEPLALPDGAEVRVRVESPSRSRRPGQQWAGVYPNNPQPASSLRTLLGVAAVGGDALADSEALYDCDW